MFAGQRYLLKKPVALIGFMGSGKSSVAKLLSEHTGIKYGDTDKEVVQFTKKTVSEIINNDGEAQFRAVEAQVFQNLINQGKIFIATGGGIVQSAVSRGLLKECFCVWLKVDAVTSEKRIEDLTARPMFVDLDNAKNLLKIRNDIYEKYSDISVDTNNKDLSEVVKEIQEQLLINDILNY